MQHEPWRPGAEPAAGAGAGPAPTTVDEASMERSMSFVKALQELKNLRPQLYSASEYCEKSYLRSEQKQVVLDNMKDYAVRALVNAVDHLGTVAYKLTDLYEEQASEITTLELKVACLNQQVRTCQTYTDKEGLRQQQMMGAARRHHNHYIVPYAGNKRMQAFSVTQADADFDPTPRPFSSARTLEWHLVSEKNSKTSRPDQSEIALGETKTTKASSSGFRLLGKESSASPLSRNVQSNITSLDIVSAGMKDQPTTRHLSSFSSLDNPRGRQIQKAPLRTKSMLAAFFVKHRSAKMKNVSVR
ncbi:Probable protein ABIL1 [Zea mays]|nr:Probable protein ABIL1 [Zea mays]